MKAILFLIAKQEKNKFFRLQTILELSLIAYLTYSNISNINEMFGVPNGLAIYAIMIISFFVGISQLPGESLEYTDSDTSFAFCSPLSNTSLIFLGIYQRLSTVFRLLLALSLPLIVLINNYTELSVLFSILLVIYIFITVGCIYIIRLTVTTRRNKKIRLFLEWLFYLVLIFSISTLIFLLLCELSIAFKLKSIFFDYIRNICLINSKVSPTRFLILSLSIKLLITILGFVFVLSRDIYELMSEKSTRKRIESIEISNVLDYGVQKYSYGAPAMFFKQIDELNNQNKKPFLSIKTFLVMVVTSILAIGISQITGEEGIKIDFIYISIMFSGISSMICMSLAPDRTYAEDHEGFRRIPVSPYLKAFFMILVTYIRAIFIGIISTSVLLIYNKISFINLPIIVFMFLSMVLVYSFCPFVFRRYLPQIESNSIIGIYMSVFISILFCIPGIVLFIVANIIFKNLFTSAFLLIIVNVLIGYLQIKMSKRII
ncbi:MAG: hypothetical protein GX972_09155 [Amphibacillus sp.]|nr:hypothetical protein [Amphibacillus sp.]